MSFRFDTPLVPSAFHFGNRGLGVKGSQIPSAGTNGKSYIYDSLNLPADANKEYSGFVETPPGVGYFFAFEDGSFHYSGPSTSFIWRLREDGADLGTATTTIHVGVTGSCSYTEADDVSQLQSYVTSVNATALAWVEDADILSVTNTLTAYATNGWTEDVDTVFIAASILGVVTSAITYTEASDTFSALTNLTSFANISTLEVDDVHSVSANVLGTIGAINNWTEVDDSLSIAVTLSITSTGVMNWSEPDDTTLIYVQRSATAVMAWTESNDYFTLNVSLPQVTSPIPATLSVKFKNPKYTITFKRE